MRLGIQILQDYQTANSFEYSQVAEFNKGEAVRIYFQLIDLSKEINRGPRGASYLRYLPSNSATCTVLLHNIDDALVSNKVAAMAVPTQDTSIWYFDILPTDKIGSGNLGITLIDQNVTLKGVLIEGLKAYGTDPGSISFC